MSESTAPSSVPASTDPVSAADLSERMIPLSAVAPLLDFTANEIRGRHGRKASGPSPLLDPLLVVAYDIAAEQAGYFTSKELLNHRIKNEATPRPQPKAS